MHQKRNNYNIGILLPPSPRGPGMIKSPALDVANMISILKSEKEHNVQLFDLRAHTVAKDSFWKKRGVDLSIFNDFNLCFKHVLIKNSLKINVTVKKILKETALDGINFVIFFVSILEQFSLQYFTSALCIAYQLKKTDPSMKIIFSGNCPQKHIRQIMHDFKFLDAFLEDGNEHAISEYIKNFETSKALKSVIYREGTKLIHPKGKIPLLLNKFPEPDFSLFDLEKYKSNGKLIFPYELSRGCINNCFFCYYIYKGGKIHKKSYKKAVKELICLRNKYNVKVFHFIDAEINFDNDYLKNFCTELLKEKADISWSALAVPTNLDSDLLKLMKESGCVQLRFGVESGGSDLLKIIKKNTNIPEMSKILKDAHCAGIYTYITLINGLPMERQEDILGTKKFLYKNKQYIDSSTVCDYGELGHFGVHVLENLLFKIKPEKISPDVHLTGKILRDYSKRIGLKQEDIINDFLSKINNYE